MKSPHRTFDFQNDRIVVWFSAGATSAVAAYLTCRDFPRENIRIMYCDTGSEHPSNRQFVADCQRLLNHPIEALKSPDYTDIWEVFEKTRYLSGPEGARCTVELKKRLRQQFEKFNDIQVFGYDAGEQKRAQDFIDANPEVKMYAPLIEKGITKGNCLWFLKERGIELPFMYQPQKSGAPYNHNNCIGCVKGKMGYWNKIRVDFPEVFDRMAQTERKIGHAICKKEIRVDGKRVSIPVFLDELDPQAGRFEDEPQMSCDLLCRLDLAEAAT